MTTSPRSSRPGRTARLLRQAPTALRITATVVTLAAVTGGVVAATSGDEAIAAGGSTAPAGAASPAGERALPRSVSGAAALSAAADERAEKSAARGADERERKARQKAAREARERREREREARERAAARERAQARARASRQAARDPKGVARLMLADHGWGRGQFSCLDALWEKESNWNVRADNPTSSAYGIPQALPGSKMSSAGSDWETNPVTQIRWGLGYIAERYGSPCAAWAHSRANNWY